MTVDSSTQGPLRLGVLVSGHGRGTNLQAILDACSSGALNACVALVIGTREGAPALERARVAGVPTVVVGPKEHDSEEGYGVALEEALLSAEAELICLAGYMRLLPKNVVDGWHRRILNVHPALLPLFGGKGMYGANVHTAVLESGMKVTGCTVHLVDDEYDSGEILVQRCIPVTSEDTPATLAARLLPEEHAAYIDAIRLFCP